jgi:hypothetical protein
MITIKLRKKIAQDDKQTYTIFSGKRMFSELTPDCSGTSSDCRSSYYIGSGYLEVWLLQESLLQRMPKTNW